MIVNALSMTNLPSVFHKIIENSDLFDIRTYLPLMLG